MSADRKNASNEKLIVFKPWVRGKQAWDFYSIVPLQWEKLNMQFPRPLTQENRGKLAQSQQGQNIKYAGSHRKLPAPVWKLVAGCWRWGQATIHGDHFLSKDKILSAPKGCSAPCCDPDPTKTTVRAGTEELIPLQTPHKSRVLDARLWQGHAQALLAEVSLGGSQMGHIWDGIFGTWSSSERSVPSSRLLPAKSVLCKDISSQGGDNMRNSSCFRAGFPISSSLEMSLLLIRHFHWKSSNCQQQFTRRGSVIFCSNLVNGALWKQVLRCVLDQCSQGDSSRFSSFWGFKVFVWTGIWWKLLNQKGASALVLCQSTRVLPSTGISALIQISLELDCCLLKNSWNRGLSCLWLQKKLVMLVYNLSQTVPGPISGLNSRGQLQSFVNFWWMDIGGDGGRQTKTQQWWFSWNLIWIFSVFRAHRPTFIEWEQLRTLPNSEHVCSCKSKLTGVLGSNVPTAHGKWQHHCGFIAWMLVASRDLN